MVDKSANFVRKSKAQHIEIKNADIIPEANCLEWKKKGCNENGIYPIAINGVNNTINNKGVPVYCDMVTDGGGWTVIQNRFDGSVNFDRLWEEYKNGFGSLNGEFWLGNEILYRLSQQNHENMQLKFEATRFSDESINKVCNNFKLTSEEDSYKISFSSVEGVEDAPDLNGTKFTTRDRDNDLYPSNCAIDFPGGWWFSGCFYVNLNGLYVPNGKDMFAEYLMLVTRV